jgi:uncharacterized protein YecE (DUF72 family)
MNRWATIRGRVERVGEFCRAVRALGDRLGPIRVKVPQARDDGFLLLLLDSLDPDLLVALDFRHETWAAPEIDASLRERGVVRVNELEAIASFRYLRLRQPPYDDAALAAIAADVRPALEAGADVYAYFRHEDEPTAPTYAERLLRLVADR